jgi:hypothetical protein
VTLINEKKTISLIFLCPFFTQYLSIIRPCAEHQGRIKRGIRYRLSLLGKLSLRVLKIGYTREEIL